ncbi:hypothetical protein V6N12_008203 [Hibiscus sabdariffa]|uniref:Uncharacterized protein n=1 Tax=Hibiscus sabdariffa TaxID=183260 RepID=A0ABR2AAL0_9ROSI
MCRRRATREDSPCPATITAIGNIDDDEGASSRGPVGPGDVEEPIGSEGNSPVAQPPSSKKTRTSLTRNYHQALSTSFLWMPKIAKEAAIELIPFDFREEKGGIRQRRKAHRAKLFLFLGRSPLAYVVVGLPTRTRPPECLLGSGRSQADTYDRRRKDPHLIAPGERKFDRGLERRGGRKGSGWI